MYCRISFSIDDTIEETELNEEVTMHSIIKSSFYIVFIAISLVAGISMLTSTKGDKKAKLFGFMILVLGIGEGFHLLPRILEIFTHNTTTLEPYINTGRFIASMTIIFVYLILYWFYKVYYKVSNTRNLDIVLYVLAVIGVTISVVLMNSEGTLLIVLRNLPMVIIGSIIALELKKQASEMTKHPFKYLWLAVLLAMVFTVGFELLSASYPFFIILMMPKTLMYIWLVLMGYIAYKKNNL